MKQILFAALGLTLIGCVTPTGEGAPKQSFANPDVAAARFVEVVRRVEPVAERECRRRAPGQNCDYHIVVLNKGRLPINAMQTQDRKGRPILVFTAPLIGAVLNADELAFVMGHEAAHHIRGHIKKSQRNAELEALRYGREAEALGANRAGLQQASLAGAARGALQYSQNFELEADVLGTIIAKRAGFDPVRGAQFFTRLPDPKEIFRSTHPANSKRIETVRKTAAGLR